MRLPAGARQRLDADLTDARQAETSGDVARAWALLEEAHILSQRAAWPHVRVHARMLGLAWRQRDHTELRGQALRLVVAAPGSLSGRYPVGNTGRSNVPATLPMPVPAELQALLTR